eukprot:CAMPEP_0116011306 /NCGR_PEP_ID=MMETSP0321-20121206/4496_1 /TAXON_ID=163516 /ORGANISM="Leptocylindrus danicus var. danicus, Strain B650" /LENGTH=478 /DNA_ID=CAMNT_0003480527 /DNA_START=45 /DNA_END=1479 /DNA_ORIENTATION=+
MGMMVEPLPKVHVDDLKDQFDEMYLDQLPVIITGTTACPGQLSDFQHINRHCGGWVPGNYVKTKANNANEAQWAGFNKATGFDEKIDFLNFVESMGRSDDISPRFMFDVSMVDICPQLLPHILLPPQFVGIFASQYLWHRYEDDDVRKCSNMPFMNMYLAEAGFETDLHIDSAHTAFIASMCVGRKKWRVITHSNFDQFYSELVLRDTGIKVDGKWVNSEIRRPFETWSDQSSPLLSMDISVYEGILEPGEILYIPPGAPHAAITLDQSLMVASNDQSIQSLREIDHYCDKHASWFGCNHFRSRLPTVEENYEEHADKIERHSMAFAKAFDCERAVDTLTRQYLNITSKNFQDEIRKGPIIVMKYVRSCLHCLQLFKMLEESIRLSSLRFGVLNCPVGKCDRSSNKDYNKFSDMTREEPPEFVFISCHPGTGSFRGTPNAFDTTIIAHYFGPIEVDFLKVWIMMKTKNDEAYDVSPWW